MLRYPVDVLQLCCVILVERCVTVPLVKRWQLRFVILGNVVSVAG